jgi:hypothetical protein
MKLKRQLPDAPFMLPQPRYILQQQALARSLSESKGEIVCEVPYFTAVENAKTRKIRQLIFLS